MRYRNRARREGRKVFGLVAQAGDCRRFEYREREWHEWHDQYEAERIAAGKATSTKATTETSATA
jgi:hypothetical protein